MRVSLDRKDSDEISDVIQPHLVSVFHRRARQEEVDVASARCLVPIAIFAPGGEVTGVTDDSARCQTFRSLVERLDNRFLLNAILFCDLLSAIHFRDEPWNPAS